MDEALCSMPSLPAHFLSSLHYQNTSSHYAYSHFEYFSCCVWKEWWVAYCTLNTLEKLLSTLSLSLYFRWKYGSKTSDPNTRRSWRTGPVDLRETTSPPRRRPPRLRAPCGTSAWPPKARRCTLEDTWTILLTGTPDTSRTPCRGLRWCDRQEHATLPGQIMDLYQQADWSC